MEYRQVVLATRNLDKLREMKQILNMPKLRLTSLLDFMEAPEVIEDGKTLKENAFKKARSAYKYSQIPSLADDSGLEVDFLNGAPGVYSSRFAGESVSYTENNQKLLTLLKDVPRDQRKARFRCVVALVDDENETSVEGVCEGMILSECRGENGFGYDPVFYVPEHDKTFAEMTPKEKHKISHRGIAFRKMEELLNQLAS